MRSPEDCRTIAPAPWSGTSIVQVTTHPSFAARTVGRDPRLCRRRPARAAADGLGELHLAGLWPAAIPPDTDIWLQLFFIDPGAVHGLSATGGMRLLVP
ncbi:MAG TPA: hypothetical protein VFY71_05155 [Planctomycetota bacterium]|nr:hypothetical protein [Planctomycetota bacterium]